MVLPPVLQGILSGMKQFDDEGAQLSSLSELCELLSISTEESLSTFPIEQVVPLLVRHCLDLLGWQAQSATRLSMELPVAALKKCCTACWLPVQLSSMSVD